MDKVRFGIVGLGNIGRFHASNLLDGKVRRAELTAVCTRKSDPFGSGSPVATFPELGSLLESDTVDAVIIATPHPQHPDEGIAALRAGRHVLMEKPIAAHKADGEKLVAVHREHPDSVFGAMYQFRTQPRYQQIRRLVANGELGPIVRVNWINTDWFRPQAYYNSTDWRATWSGEGGGVLINQCLHNLDTLQWICGMPRRVRGFCQLGRWHDIEVEDDATAWFEWDNEATGVFVGSTGESPGTNRLEIAGTLGRLVLEHDRLVVDRNDTDAMKFCRQTKEGFAKLAVEHSEVKVENAEAPHVAILQNFVNAILDGEPLIAPGAEGLNSLELANAILFSSLLGRTVELPMDSAAWKTKLDELSSRSTFKKKVVADSSGDVANSFQG